MSHVFPSSTHIQLYFWVWMQGCNCTCMYMCLYPKKRIIRSCLFLKQDTQETRKLSLVTCSVIDRWELAVYYFCSFAFDLIAYIEVGWVASVLHYYYWQWNDNKLFTIQKVEFYIVLLRFWYRNQCFLCNSSIWTLLLEFNGVFKLAAHDHEDPGNNKWPCTWAKLSSLVA